MFTFRPGIHFEAMPDVAPAGAGAADPGLAADPAAGLPTEPAVPAADPAAAAPDPGGLPDPADLFGPPAGQQQQPDPIQQLQGQVQSLADMIAQSAAGDPQAGQPGQAADPYANWDPFNPQSVIETVGQAVRDQITQMFDQRLGGVEQVSNLFAEREATNIANQHFDQIEGQLGPFDRGMAMEFLGHALARGEDPSQALVGAAQRAQAMTRQAMIQGATMYRERLAAAASAHAEPPAGAGGATPADTAPAQQGDSPYRSAARGSLSRLRALPPAGA